jgi:hypothetical protein
MQGAEWTRLRGIKTGGPRTSDLSDRTQGGPQTSHGNSPPTSIPQQSLSLYLQNNLHMNSLLHSLPPDTSSSPEPLALGYKSFFSLPDLKHTHGISISAKLSQGLQRPVSSGQLPASALGYSHTGLLWFLEGGWAR